MDLKSIKDIIQILIRNLQEKDTQTLKAVDHLKTAARVLDEGQKIRPQESEIRHDAKTLMDELSELASAYPQEHNPQIDYDEINRELDEIEAEIVKLEIQKTQQPYVELPGEKFQGSDSAAPAN